MKFRENDDKIIKIKVREEPEEKMDISVVVPVYGCPNAIPELHRRLVETLDKMGASYEIILVDDCDEMGSWEEVKKVALKDKRVKAIHFTRNCGQGRAVAAGVYKATGDWIVPMDCDLQDAPENIPILYDKVRQGGLDVVFVRRQKRKDSFIVQSLSKLFHKVFSYLAEIDFDYSLGTYLIASKRAADYFRKSRDRGRDFTMFLLWLGLKADYVEFEHDRRYDGKSSFTFRKKWEHAISTMTTFSNRILYVPITVGLAAAAGSVLYVLFVFAQFILKINNPEGWNTLAAALFFFSGLILSTLGVIGVYLGNIFDMNKDRPLYVIQEEINCDEENQ